MKYIKNYKVVVTALVCILFTSCKMLAPVSTIEKQAVPESFATSKDTINSAKIKWNVIFKDKNLNNLIEIALKNNIELAVTLQEIEIARNDVRVRKGILLPSVNAVASAGVDKVGRYTSTGAGDASTDITPGNEVPEKLGDFMLGLKATWEVDIWKKLRNSKKAAYSR